jgi:hypothetical protein
MRKLVFPLLMLHRTEQQQNIGREVTISAENRDTGRRIAATVRFFEDIPGRQCSIWDQTVQIPPRGSVLVQTVFLPVGGRVDVAVVGANYLERRTIFAYLKSYPAQPIVLADSIYCSIALSTLPSRQYKTAWSGIPSPRKFTAIIQQGRPSSAIVMSGSFHPSSSTLEQPVGIVWIASSMAKISWITGCGPAMPSTAPPVVASEGTVTYASPASAAVEVTSRVPIIMCVSFICGYLDRRSFRWVQSHAHAKATDPYNRPSKDEV